VAPWCTRRQVETHYLWFTEGMSRDGMKRVRRSRRERKERCRSGVRRSELLEDIAVLFEGQPRTLLFVFIETPESRTVLRTQRMIGECLIGFANRRDRRNLHQKWRSPIGICHVYFFGDHDSAQVGFICRRDFQWE